MCRKYALIFSYLTIVLLSLALVGCTAGGPRYTDEAAGFWSGLWHGAISLITLVISFFSDTVRIYELNNTGGWYDFGFMLGVLCIWGSGWGSGMKRSGIGKKKTEERKRKDKEWEDIGEKVEEKILRKMKKWAEAEETGEWDEIGKKVEEKLKKKIREWAEEE